MIRRPPRSTLDRSSAASDVYKRQFIRRVSEGGYKFSQDYLYNQQRGEVTTQRQVTHKLSLIHISEPTRPY